MPSELQRSPISIHAPREGGDTMTLKEAYRKYIISIHAPREGGDHGGEHHS